MIDYKQSGVDVEEGYRAVGKYKSHAKRTSIPGVLNGLGSFAGMFEVPAGMKNPVMVSGTDGVGTKLDIAFAMKKYDTVGIDCVAMSVNDILCTGAKPLYFLDYVACGKLDADVAADLVKGVADGCVDSNCALLGGETAEMPGFYDEGKYDIAGFGVGIVEKDEIITGEKIEDGDVLIGLASTGVHSNGFSLVRKVFDITNKEVLMEVLPDGRTLGEALLAPTQIYVKPVLALLEKVQVKAISHITGGGFNENIPRSLPDGYTAKIKKNSYEVPYIFKLLQERGNVNEHDMYNTFNMGIGMSIVIPKESVAEAIALMKEFGIAAYEIGEIVKGDEGIIIE